MGAQCFTGWAWRLPALVLLAMMSWPALAGLTVYTKNEAGFNAPTPVANLRTVDFSSVLLSGEQTASRLTYTPSMASGASVSYTTTSTGLTSFAGNSMRITSGSSTTTSTLTINFQGGGTPYVSFLWGLSLADQNSLSVVLSLSNGTTVTLNNCESAASNLCVGYYIASNWLADLLGGLLGALFGGNSYESVYVNYAPASGVKITSMQIRAGRCDNCGFLSSPASQYFHLDNLSYLDATVVPHHLEVTTSSASASPGAEVTFTIKACANAACSALYTTGVSGNLSITGVTPSYPAGQAYAIPSGSSSTTIKATMSAGTATVALSATPVPSDTTKVYCGMGVAAASANSCTLNVAAAVHHLRLTGPTSALTCSASSFTVTACADATCSVPFTAGIQGNLDITGGTVIYPAGKAFVILPGASSVSLAAQMVTAGTATAGLSGLSIAPSGNPQVSCSMGAAPNSGACTYPVNSAGLLLTVATHTADQAQVVSVKAVEGQGATAVCKPALAGLTRDVRFSCGYSNPASGTLPVRVSGNALNAGNNAAAACDGPGRSVAVTFDANGEAPITVQYADAGKVTLNAAYTGTPANQDTGLSMTGTTTFTTVPAGFAMSNLSAGNIKAGVNFSARVNAVNASGSLTPNFGRESPPELATLAFARREPRGTGARDGDFTGTVVGFSAGSPGYATGSALKWSEVGRADLSYTLADGNYLETNRSVSGASCAAEGGTCVLPAGAVATVFYGANGSFSVSTGRSGSVACNSSALVNTVGSTPKHCSYTVTSNPGGAMGSAAGALAFIPDHFDVAVTQACGTFTYSGQPFDMTVTALNAANVVTRNYDGSALTTAQHARDVGITAFPAVTSGSIDMATVAAAAFSAGAASVRPSFTFTNKLTAPQIIGLRAIDINGVTSMGYNEGSVPVRSGQLKVSNAFGSEKADLLLPVQAQYWSGRAWVLNDQDSCTAVPASAVAMSGYRDSKGAAAAWTTSASLLQIQNGHGRITLSSPGSGLTGSVDVALNLGLAITDQSCLGGTRPDASPPAAVPWLRSQYGASGACAGSFVRDPSARATFGVFSPESRKTMYSREAF